MVIDFRPTVLVLLLLVAGGCGLVDAQEPRPALSDFADGLDKSGWHCWRSVAVSTAIPKTAGDEERTARVVAEYLESVGFRVSTGIRGHGVVGVVEGSASVSDESLSGSFTTSRPRMSG